MSATNSGKKKSKKSGEEKAPGRLVLCFDGTGNKFTGVGDTNIVKLYQMCDRESKGQYHYYQPGIGTYSASESSINAGVFGSITRWFSQVIDQGIGTTFDHHVIAGYKFLMRYYKPGDLVFIFGFSRGAFTARFLARMVTQTGLLSRGNEEMVPFAYRTYQDYVRGHRFKTTEESKAFMKIFKETFCRKEVNIHFLGLFDTVNSVGTFELPFSKGTYLPVHAPAASHIRHAVAFDERRLKFKPALFDQDDFEVQDGAKDSVIKEVWFPGNHGDVGGGWDPEVDRKTKVPKHGGVQLSDLVLEWMIKELDELPGPEDEKLSFNLERKTKFLAAVDEHRAEVVKEGLVHDALQPDKGWSFVQVGFWWIFEILPIFKRQEIKEDPVTKKWVWKSQYYPPCWGKPRDLPAKGVLHPTVLQRVDAQGLRPSNDNWQDAKAHTLALLNGTS